MRATIRKMSIGAVLVFGFMGCASIPGGPDANRETAAEKPTIWSLKKMAEDGQLDALNDLFNNHGIHIDRLPVGYAAGTGARVFNPKLSIATQALDGLTGANWRGKMFFPSNNPQISKGLNRIKESLLLPMAPIVPMASFQVEVLDHHSLVPEARTNLIVLNYSKPITKRYWHELLLSQVQVYDIVVAIQGKYGPLLVGKTFLGKYDKNRIFHTDHPDRLTAWFFLDFNPGALKAQQEEHWDGVKEEKLDPLPRVTEKLKSLAANAPAEESKLADSR